jgi:MFS transporter, ACS family, tartrate transporter
MISRGLVSAAFALMGGPVSFLVLRFLLGASEGGFFPGVILYLVPVGIPQQDRWHLHGGHSVAGLPGSLIFWGMDDMQWVFILEALPAVSLGLVWLADRPEHAAWLTAEQRGWLANKLTAEQQRAGKVQHLSVWQRPAGNHADRGAGGGNIAVLVVGRGQPRMVAVQEQGP